MNNFEVLLVCHCEKNTSSHHLEGNEFFINSIPSTELIKSITFNDYTLVLDCRVKVSDIPNLLYNLPYVDSTTFSWLFPIMDLDEIIHIPFLEESTNLSNHFTQTNKSKFASIPGTMDWPVVLLNNLQIRSSGLMDFIHHSQLEETIIAKFGFRTILSLSDSFKTAAKLEFKKSSLINKLFISARGKFGSDLFKLVYSENTLRNGISILIDARSVTSKYNGTIIYSIHLIDELLDNKDLKVNLLIDIDGVQFHKKKRWLEFELNTNNLDKKFDIAIKLDQFWEDSNILELHNYAWKVGCIFLDIIAYDINYPVKGLAKLWFNSKYLLDFIVFLSNDGFEKYQQRFGALPLENILILHPAFKFKVPELLQEESVRNRTINNRTRILTLGNSYFFKEMTWANDFLRYNFPNFEVEIIDAKSELDTFQLYKKFMNTDIVFIPSRYEGFGLNISLALTFNKFIVVRKNRLNEEIFNTIPEHQEHFLFKSDEELISFFSKPIPGENKFNVAKLRNWGDVAGELIIFLEKIRLLDTYKSFEFRNYYE